MFIKKFGVYKHVYKPVYKHFVYKLANPDRNILKPDTKEWGGSQHNF